jgi:Skp family chaperone for outer membrane proteins
MSVILVVDLAAVLDTSTVGKDATKQLEKSWKDAQSQPEEKQRALLARLEKQREALRAALLARVKPVVQELAKKKGALAVLEKGAVLYSTGEDITKDVIAKVDAGGPLKA